MGASAYVRSISRVRLLAPCAVFLAAVVAGSDGGCSSNAGLKAPPPCTSKCVGAAADQGAAAGSTGAGGSGGAAGTGGVGGSGITITGTVVELDTPDFMTQAAYSGQATIQVPQLGGGTVQGTYGGAGGGGTNMFDIMMAAPSSQLQWVFVENDVTTGAMVYSTWSQATFSTCGQVLQLPVVNIQTLTDVATQLATPTTLSPGAGQVILFLTMGTPTGPPIADATLTNPLNGATIAYDQGPGVYSSDATETGTAGTVLVLNAPVSVGTALNLSFQFGTGAPESFSVPVSSDAATVATLVF
jgi:hypothetical protein